MKKNKIRSVILIGSGLFIIIAAVVLAAYNLWDDSRAGDAAGEALIKVNEIAQKNAEAHGKESGKDNASGEQEEKIPDYVLDPNMEMPVIAVDGYRYIGTISIPSLRVELPVMEDWDYDKMKIAPCRYSGSAYLNNMVICAHNYNSHFGHIDNLQYNDLVRFTDAEGNIFRYRVEEIETLDGAAVEEMTSGSWALSLFTCNYSGRARVTVRCKWSEK